MVDDNMTKPVSPPENPRVARVSKKQVFLLLFTSLNVILFTLHLTRTQTDLKKIIYELHDHIENISRINEIHNTDLSSADSIKSMTERHDMLKTRHHSSMIEGTERYLTINDVPRIKVGEADCWAMFKGDDKETERVIKYDKSLTKRISDDLSLLKRASNCSTFQRMRQYPMYPMSAEEEAFPIAYAMMMYKHAEMAERLLRSVYRPQNIYCIQVDNKSDPDVKNAMKAVADCFDNVFLLTPSISVKWGKFSALHPYVLCADELLKRNKQWRYFINLTGEEFPLKTNWDLVRILSVFNGSNDIPGHLFSEENNGTRRRVIYEPPYNKYHMVLNPPVPHNITLTKGSAHAVASREFINFTVNSEVGRDYLEWCKNTNVPDEHFFSSLQHSPHLGVPGAFRGHPIKDGSMNRFKYWRGSRYPCSGTWMRTICIFGVGDLKNMFSSEKLFVNKFHYDYQPLTYDCLEELHFNKTREDILGTRQLELAPYKIAYFVQDRVRMFNGEPPLPYTPITKPRKKKPAKAIEKIKTESKR